MKKSLIALAVVSTLVAPVAMAETSNVNVYGQVNLSLDMVKSGGTNGATANQVSSNESRLGFKGSEDLGGGVSAIFQIERGIAADGSSDTMSSRNTFGGLKSDVGGSLVLGIHDTPYKIATRRLDVFNGTIADNRGIMGGDYHDMRFQDSINYMSPSWGGFSVAAAYGLGAEGTTSSTQSKGKGISVAGMYEMGPIYVAAAHQKITDGSAGTGTFAGTPGDSDKAMKVGVGYKMDMFAVNAVLENLKGISGGVSDKTRNLYVAGQFNITASDAIKVAVTQQKDWDMGGVTQPNTGSRQLSIGYDHNLSNRTTVYALWSKISNKQNVNNALQGQSSSVGSSLSTTAGADPSAISIGLKHWF